MPIDIDMTRKFVVNGREYGSMDELPEDIRASIQKAMREGKNVEVNTTTAIVFNGKAYRDVGEMPTNERLLYEQVMEAASGKKADEKEIKKFCGALGIDFTVAPAHSSAPGASVSFSLGPLFTVIIAIALALGLYIYFRA